MTTQISSLFLFENHKITFNCVAKKKVWRMQVQRTQDKDNAPPLLAARYNLKPDSMLKFQTEIVI